MSADKHHSMCDHTECAIYLCGGTTIMRFSVRTAPKGHQRCRTITTGVWGSTTAKMVYECECRRRDRNTRR